MAHANANADHHIYENESILVSSRCSFLTSRSNPSAKADLDDYLQLKK
jgi:hypothetical protein